MSRLNKLAGLAEERRDARLTQKTLALRSGLDDTHISRYETGDRRMSRESAEKLAGVLKGASVPTMMLKNREATMRKAMHDKDIEGVYKAVASAVKVYESEEGDADDEAVIIELLQESKSYFESLGSRSSRKAHAEPAGERYDEPGMDGRDARGRWVGEAEVAVKDADDAQRAWGSVPDPYSGGREPDPEEFAVDDGRDANGHRIVGWDELDGDDDTEDYDEYEEDE